MLKVDLSQLGRVRRLEIAESLMSDDPLLEGTGLTLRGQFHVRLEARATAGGVFVDGRLDGEVVRECRRCLEPVVVPISEEVALHFRTGLDPVEAEFEEVYAIPERSRELDLAGPVREHLLLTVPEYVVCRESCRGFCPRCGAEQTERSCGCAAIEPDERWAVLRDLKLG